jgi:hypothetical protein
MDALDQDVQALKEWLGKAWRYLAQAAHTRYDRQEMRQQMKLVEAKLRIGLQKVAARDQAALAIRPGILDDLARPNWRLLNIQDGLVGPKAAKKPVLATSRDSAVGRIIRAARELA